MLDCDLFAVIIYSKSIVRHVAAHLIQCFHTFKHLCISSASKQAASTMCCNVVEVLRPSVEFCVRDMKLVL